MEIENTLGLVNVIATKSHRVWAYGSLRAEVAQYNSRRWKWRVWHVIGPMEIARGLEYGVKDAKRMALELLTSTFQPMKEAE